MADRLPERILRDLREARESALLVRSSFDGMGKNRVVRVFEGDRDVAEQWPSMTDLIREKVQLHHQSWIVRPIDRVLSWSASTDDGSQAEWSLVGRLRVPWPNPAVLEEAARELERVNAENAVLRGMLRDVGRSVESAEVRLKELAPRS
jgi:hypothetical protein